MSCNSWLESSRVDDKRADSTCWLQLAPTCMVIWRVTPATVLNLKRAIPLAALRLAYSSCNPLSTRSYPVILEVTMADPLTLKRAKLSNTMKRTEDSSWLQPAARSIPEIVKLKFPYLRKVPNENIPIYNFVSGPNTLTFQENTNVLLEKILEVPSAQAIWYPLVIPFRSVLWYRVFAIFVHVIPGALLDIAFVIKGSPPKLVKLYRKIDKYMISMEYFTTSSWNFDNRFNRHTETQADRV
uniref:Fatty acyl-CoA reductase C-terminal domain-containing protein n=1 Tax=Timema poppense TaxID=170557 RepID=A0A7R9HAF5_TIMPO|nr:unnamed protein product [Timema poppensis]